MKTIKITDPVVIEQIREALPVATQEKKGLMSKNGIIGTGMIPDGFNPDDLGNCFGYQGSADGGSGAAGPILSIRPSEATGFQIKANYDGGYIKYRTKNPVTGEWTKWKQI